MSRTDPTSTALALLVAGDLHLGRSSSRAPGTGGALRTIAAWERLVDVAMAQRADALVLTGDLVDRANRHWEAIGPIVRGVGRLRAAGIPTIAVSGNHDFDVLPAIARQVADPTALRLLGGGGRWERMLLEARGQRVQLDGWSFPTEAVERDPVESHAMRPTPGVPTLGVVHGDLDAPRSRYAPLRSSVLAARPVDGWLLGHVHAPSLRPLAGAFALYPGSPQAMDFGERGAHGAWMVRVDGSRVAEPTFIPLSSVRYEELSIALEENDDIAALQGRVLGALRDLEGRCALEGRAACAGLAARLRLHGRTAAWRDLASFAEEIRGYEGSGSLQVRIDQVDVDALPPIDLDQLAGGWNDDGAGASSPLAIAAGLLRSLEGGPPSAAGRALIGAAHAELRRVRDLPEYAQVRDASTADDRAEGAAHPGDVRGDVRGDVSGDVPGDGPRRLLCESLRSLIGRMLAQEAAR